MWYKVIDEKLIPPPVNFITPEGATICNFNLSPALMTKYGWSDWTPEEEAQWREEHPEPKPPVTLEELTELTYKAKAEVSYGGLTFIKDGTSYQFDTDVDSITMCNSQVLLMASQPDDFQFGWKVYLNNHPTLFTMTKAEFIKVYGFGNIMINTAFGTEGALNAHYEQLTPEELSSLDIDSEIEYIRGEFAKIQRVYEL